MSHSREFTDKEKIEEWGKSYDFETTKVEGRVYNVGKLWEFADQFPVQESADRRSRCSADRTQPSQDAF